MSTETQLLATLMHNNHLIGAVSEMLRPKHFSTPQLETVFDLMLELHGDSQPADPETINTLAARKTLMRHIGGPTTVHMLYGQDFVDVDFAIDSIIEGYGRRELSRVAYAAREMADEGNVDAHLATLTSILDGIRNERGSSSTQSAAEVLAELKEEVLNPQPHRRLATPWPSLTNFMGGFRPGQLIVVGARPGIGKTVCALNIAMELVKRGPVLFNSLEMSTTELMMRVVSAQQNIPFGSLHGSSPFQSADKARLQAAEAHFPLYLEDTTYTLDKIIATARAHHRKAGLSALVVDYLQLISPTRLVNRQEFVAECSRSLKLLGRELDIPVFALSQLNRGNESERRMPRLSDLRESGAIEQDADIVLLMHRDLESDERDTLKLGVAKNRSGQTGVVNLRFDGHYMRIVE